MLNLRNGALKSFLIDRVGELFPNGQAELIDIVAIALYDAITRIQEDKGLTNKEKGDEIDLLLNKMMERPLVWLRKEYKLNYRIQTAERLEETGRCPGAKQI